MNTKYDFADQNFKIECCKMMLSKGGETSLSLEGPGEIWQDHEGVLQYKIFLNEESFLSLGDLQFRSFPPGQLIKDDDFFTLHARDISLPVWVGPQIIPNARGGLHEGLAHGRLSELIQEEPYPEEAEFDVVLLRFKGRIEFPSNRGTETVVKVGGQKRSTSHTLNVAFVDVAGFTFEMRHEREHTVASLRLPAGTATAATPSRIQEALQFVLGQQLAVMVVETMEAGQHLTRLTSPSHGHGKRPPPLQFRSLDFDGNFWRMFTDYFLHVHADSESGWHPTSCHVGSVIESAAASLDIGVLALSVAVEGLAGESFLALVPDNPELLNDLDKVKKTVDGMTLSETALNRIVGALGAMKSPRKSDALRAFITHNNMPAGLYKSWSSLRNMSAHGSMARGNNIEQLLRLKYEVLSLFYSLVFATINYKGPRIDYSLSGWPVQDWPIPQQPEKANK